MTDLYQKYNVSDDIDNATVRDGMSDMDVSKTSPLDADGREVGTAWETTVSAGGNQRHLVIRVNDPNDDFTKKSQEALTDALLSTDGVEELVEEHGGYDDLPDSVGLSETYTDDDDE